MNKIFFTVFISMLTYEGYSQVNPPESQNNSQFEKEHLLIKAKNQKATAWALLGVGTGCWVVAGVMIGTAQSDGAYTVGGGLILAGTVTALGSIPFFIAAKKNKQKATLMVTSQKASFVTPVTFSKRVTGLTLSIVL